ncbi:PAP2 family protein [Aquimarina sp. AD1]|uniref:phosphatase PAP2 family protein n=1 Tax=Aquimarina sp. (strain AD1) TaxID=1714848 RepID=UPI000E557166|nr:phosphatase PAP2 family protein [Aquimarina sp. AD1]AXT57182.1 PAP2 family protein [Aquimarina sp. AD1]RKN35830.1 phosphatase PAP2 family protein [Aquimarina sp. AD1]
MTFKYVILLTSMFLISNLFSQTDSPYETDLWIDGAWVTGAVGGSVYGFTLLLNKEGITEQELGNLNKDDIFFIDRWAAGNYSERASQISDIPFYTSFATPFLLLLNKNTRRDSGKLSVMLVESMATAGALFTITAGLVNRPRPLVYAEDAPLKDRLSKDSQRSFFSGHAAASAAATFFAAKVFSDYFPNSKAKPFVWAGAAVLPAVVSYFRVQSGNHFLTDVILGYAIGATTGILVPELHKKKNKKLSITPGIGLHQQSIRLSYRF